MLETAIIAGIWCAVIAIVAKYKWWGVAGIIAFFVIGIQLGF